MDTTSQVSAPILTHTEQKALDLLSVGIPAGAVAAAIGVSASRIAQLMGDERFASVLAERKYESLTAHNARDSKYDALEDKALEQLEENLPLVMDPLKLTRIIQTLNAAKRRGHSAPESVTNKQTIIQLTLPVQILNRFSVEKNINNQVVAIEDQSMVTIQSGQVQKIAERVRESRNVSELRAREELKISSRNLDCFGFEGSDPAG